MEVAILRDFELVRIILNIEEKGKLINSKAWNRIEMNSQGRQT